MEISGLIRIRNKIFTFASLRFEGLKRKIWPPFLQSNDLRGVFTIKPEKLYKTKKVQARELKFQGFFNMTVSSVPAFFHLSSRLQKAAAKLSFSTHKLTPTKVFLNWPGVMWRPASSFFMFMK